MAPPDRVSLALVVDDDALIRMDAVDILEEAGFGTLEAASADEALEVLRKRHAEVQVLFTDVQMPGTMNGFALACETARCWPEITIVVASGHLKPKAGNLPERAHFIGKPFSAAVVREHLNAAVPEQAKPPSLKASE